jgi:extracellular elastinolytic metalloproteinase
VEALQTASETLQLPVKADGASAEPKEGTKVYALKGTEGANAEPEAKLVYFVKSDGTLALTWRVETDIVDNWLLTYVDAENNSDIHGVVDYVADVATYKV